MIPRDGVVVGSNGVSGSNPSLSNASANGPGVLYTRTVFADESGVVGAPRDERVVRDMLEDRLLEADERVWLFTICGHHMDPEETQ